MSSKNTTTRASTGKSKKKAAPPQATPSKERVVVEPASQSKKRKILADEAPQHQSREVDLTLTAKDKEELRAARNSIKNGGILIEQFGDVLAHLKTVANSVEESSASASLSAPITKLNLSTERLENLLGFLHKASGTFAFTHSLELLAGQLKAVRLRLYAKGVLFSLLL